jgi:glycosyltransferase involved in cell wall biosynthesis
LALSSPPIDLLLKAFQVVAVGLPNARLLIVCGGESRDKLQTLADELGIANRTLFVGRISPDQVGAYYRMCNVLVDPVIDDETAAGRCPLKLFESWYCGIPFVTSAVGDRGELLGNPPAGLLANPGDATDLAMTLKRILLDPNLASDLSNRGLEQVKRYTWDVLGEKLINVINRLI